VTGSLLLALTAGMLGAVNPCGFAILPAYLSLLISTDAGGAVRRALGCSAALTLGYVVVFGAFGLVLTPVAGVLEPRLPWLTVVLGLGLAAIGGWLLAGRSLPSIPVRAPALTGPTSSPQLPRTRLAPHRAFAPQLPRTKLASHRAFAPQLPRTKLASHRAFAMVLFGMAYAVASLGCAIGPFLALVATSLRAGSIGSGLLLFVAYAAGMGLVIAVTATAVALVRTSLLARARRLFALVPRIGGAVLLVCGLYVAYYGRYELGLAADLRRSGHDPLVNAAEAGQQQLAAWTGEIGAGRLAVVLVLLALVALAPRWVRLRSWKRSTGSARSASASPRSPSGSVTARPPSSSGASAPS
jgi:cytochrome c biogenesis protein CcdA